MNESSKVLGEHFSSSSCPTLPLSLPLPLLPFPPLLKASRELRNFTTYSIKLNMRDNDFLKLYFGTIYKPVIALGAIIWKYVKSLKCMINISFCPFLPEPQMVWAFAVLHVIAPLVLTATSISPQTSNQAAPLEGVRGFCSFLSIAYFWGH